MFLADRLKLVRDLGGRKTVVAPRPRRVQVLAFRLELVEVVVKGHVFRLSPRFCLRAYILNESSGDALGTLAMRRVVAFLDVNLLPDLI